MTGIRLYRGVAKALFMPVTIAMMVAASPLARAQQTEEERVDAALADVKVAGETVVKCVGNEIKRISGDANDPDHAKFQRIIEGLSERTKLTIYEHTAKEYEKYKAIGSEQFCREIVMPQFRQAFLSVYPKWIKLNTGILAKLGLMDITADDLFIQIYHNNFEEHVFGHSDITRLALEDLRPGFKDKYKFEIHKDAINLLMSASQAIDLHKWNTEAYHAHTPKHPCCNREVRERAIAQGVAEFKKVFTEHFQKALYAPADEAAFHVGGLCHMVQDLVYHHGITLLQHAGLSFVVGRDPDKRLGSESFPRLPAADTPAGQALTLARDLTKRVFRQLAAKMESTDRKLLFTWREEDYPRFDRGTPAKKVLGSQDISTWQIIRYVASSQLYVNGTRDRDVELSFDEPFGLIRWDIDAIVNELLGPPQ